jgi:hypothetical protein
VTKFRIKKEVEDKHDKCLIMLIKEYPISTDDIIYYIIISDNEDEWVKMMLFSIETQCHITPVETLRSFVGKCSNNSRCQKHLLKLYKRCENIISPRSDHLSKNYLQLSCMQSPEIIHVLQDLLSNKTNFDRYDSNLTNFENED